MGTKQKLEVIIIKFTDFATAINKPQYRMESINREVFVEEMISSVYPNYRGSHTQSSLIAFYKGSRPLFPSLNGLTCPFSINKAKKFFSEFLNSSKLEFLVNEFGIIVPDVSFDMFCIACAAQLKEFCTNSNEDVPDLMNSTCAELRENQTYEGNSRISPTDYELINELHNICPICRKQHLIKLDGTRRNYNITLIYPFDIERDNPSLANIFKTYYDAPHHINEFDNEIATCLTCHNSYKLNPTPEIYRKLKEKKISIKKERDLSESINDIELEDSIRKIMNDLLSLPRGASLTPLSMDALKVKEKIPEDDVNYDEVVLRVVRHYNFIDSLMREYESKTTDGSTRLGQEIKEISDTLIRAEKSITEILEYISRDILSKTTNDENDLPYCRIIVAYFVQNCEVLTR